MMHKYLKASIAIAFACSLCAASGSAFAGGGATIAGVVKAKKKKFLKNTIVYVETAPGTHKPPKAPVRIDQRSQKFIPAVEPVVVGTTVEFLNNDNTDHNVFSPDGEKYDLGTWAKGESRKYTFTKPGVYTQLCKMHPAMLAFVVVLQNPYFAVADEEGHFEIKNVPKGDYKLAVWNERKKAEPISVQVGPSGASGIEIELGH